MQENIWVRSPQAGEQRGQPVPFIRRARARTAGRRHRQLRQQGAELERQQAQHRLNKITYPIFVYVLLLKFPPLLLVLK